MAKQMNNLSNKGINVSDLLVKPLSPKSLIILERAAKNTIDYQCAIKCEGHALRSFGIDVSDEALEQKAKENKWLREDGIPFHNIGFLASLYGSFTSRGYYCSINDISNAIKDGKVVIAVIDNTELSLSSPWEARKKDLKSGKRPNLAVIVKSLDLKNKTIDIYEPGFTESSKTYPLEIFIEAWNDSADYLVTICNHIRYTPQPQNLSDVELEDELIELREAIAENAHDVWAKMRQAQGWSYGPMRDDDNKLHPDLRPFHLLPESEKEYDRKMAIDTIKLVKKLGWDFVKRER